MPEVLDFGIMGKISAESIEEALKNTRLKVPDEVTDEICELCGRNMVIKKGRFGKFLACPNFPACRNAKPILHYIDPPCPKCGAQLEKDGVTHVRIDYRQSGIGSGSCGPLLSEQYRLSEKEIHFVFEMEPRL